MLPKITTSQDQLLRAMATLGYPTDQTNIEQFAVLLEAFEIFLERNGRYGDVWKHSGWRGSLFDIRKKAVRMWHGFWNRGSGYVAAESELDDAYDLINYAVFFIRNTADKNADGRGFEI